MQVVAVSVIATPCTFSCIGSGENTSFHIISMNMSCVYVGVPVESWFMDDSDSHSWNHYCTGSCQLIEIRRMRMMSDYQD